MKHLVLTTLLGLLCTGFAQAQAGEADDPLEKTIDRALKYLHRTQDKDGAWRLQSEKNPAATALAVMAFLSAGHVPSEGPYGETVEKGVGWVLRSQHSSGLFSKAATYQFQSPYAMYEHGITTLMLAEVVGMMDEKQAPKVKEALEKAVQVILKAQRTHGTDAGGWRYQIQGHDADVSVTGWQLLALKAAKNVGCDVPAERIEDALKFLRRCRDSKTGGYCYRPGANLTVPCTGTAILCLELCDKHHTEDALRAGSYLLRHPPRWNENFFFYNIYYCSQATFQLGGNYWAFYRPRLHKVLMDNQQPLGHWNDRRHFGPAYATAMSVLALTVEYRFLPIYQRGDDSSDEDDQDRQPEPRTQ